MLGGAINPKNKKANFLSSFEEELGQQGADIAKAKAEVVPQKSEVAPQKSPEGAGSTWDFLPDFSNYVPDFSDYVPDISGPTAQGLFGALANFGGIAGALATGGPQAMSAFVNRIAESQQLELSREWEAFQKNEDKAFTLHRDRLQREHEAALHEKKESAIQKRVTDKGVNGLISRLRIGTKEEQNAKVIHAFTNAGLEGRAQDFIAARDKGDVATQRILAGQVWTNLGDAVPDIAKAGDLVAQGRQTVIDYVGPDNIGHIAPADFPILAKKIADEKLEQSAKQQVLKGKVDSIAGRIDATEDPNELRLAKRELDEVGKRLAQEQSPVTGIEGLETKAGTFGRNVSADEMLLTGLIQQNYEGVQSKLGLKLDSVNYAANQGNLSKEITGGQKILETGIALDLLDGPTDPKKVTKAIAAIGQSVTDPLTRLIDVVNLMDAAGAAPENLGALSAEAQEAIRLFKEHFVDPTTGEPYAEGDTDSLEFAHERIIQLFSDVKGDLSQQHSDERAKLLAGGIFDKILMGANSIDTTSLSAELTKKYDETAVKKTRDELSKILGIGSLEDMPTEDSIVYEKSTNPNLGIAFRNENFAKSMSKNQERPTLAVNKFLTSPKVTAKLVADLTQVPEGIDLNDESLNTLWNISDDKIADTVERLAAKGYVDNKALLLNHYRMAADKVIDNPQALVRQEDNELLSIGIPAAVLASVGKRGTLPPNRAQTDTYLDKYTKTREGTIAKVGQAVVGASDIGGPDVAVFEDITELMSGSAAFRQYLKDGPESMWLPTSIKASRPAVRKSQPDYGKLPMREGAKKLWGTYVKLWGDRRNPKLDRQVQDLEAALGHKINLNLGSPYDRSFVQDNAQKLLERLPAEELLLGVVGDPNNPAAIPPGIPLSKFDDPGGDPIAIPGTTPIPVDPNKTQAMLQQDNLTKIREAQRKVITMGRALSGGAGWVKMPADTSGGTKILGVSTEKLTAMQESLAKQELKAEAKMHMTEEAGQLLTEQFQSDFDAFLWDIDGKFFLELNKDGSTNHEKSEANLIANAKVWGDSNLGGLQAGEMGGPSIATSATNALLETLKTARSVGDGVTDENRGDGSVSMLRFIFRDLMNKSSYLYKARGGSDSVQREILKSKQGGTHIVAELQLALRSRQDRIQALTASSRLRNMNSGALEDDMRNRMAARGVLETFDNMSMTDSSAPFLKSAIFDMMARSAPKK